MSRGWHYNSTLEKMLYEKLIVEEKVKYDKEKRRKELEEARDQKIPKCLNCNLFCYSICNYCVYYVLLFWIWEIKKMSKS